MRNSAPAVVVELAPDRLSVFAALLMPGGALVALGVWAWVQVGADHDGRDHLATLVPTCLALAAMTLVAASRLLTIARRPGLIGAKSTSPAWQATHLNWDGHAWALLCSSDASQRPCEVAVRLDVGHWLLLQLREQPSPPGVCMRNWTCWLAISQHKLPANWHALRCALYSSRPPPDRINDR